MGSVAMKKLHTEGKREFWNPPVAFILRLQLAPRPRESRVQRLRAGDDGRGEAAKRFPPSALTTRGEIPVPVTPVQQVLYLPGLVSSSFSPFTAPSPESYLHADAILTQNRVCIYLQQTHPETRTKREEQGAKEAASPTNYRALGPTKP